MGKVTKFDIEFSNSNAVYYAGQQITGTVVIVVQQEIKIKGLNVTFTGECTVKFVDSNKRTHAERVNYFNQTDALLGSGSEGSQLLPAGVHRYPFVFTLPAGIPSSFESKLGRVRYVCTAVLRLPILKRDHTFRRPFSVVGVVDLNQEPLAFTPGYCRGTSQSANSLLACFRRSGGVQANVRLARGAFVPGEQILVHAEVENLTANRVKKVEAFIQQNVIYSTKQGGAHWERGTAKIALVFDGEIAAGQTQTWLDKPMTLPSLPPTRLGGCANIRVDYLFNFCVYTDASPSPLLLTIPLVIGTVPLRQPSASPTPAAISRQPSAPPADFEAAPPPTYEECVYMDRGDMTADADAISDAGSVDRTIVDAETDATYRPVYPMYPTLRPYYTPTPIAQALPTKQ